ncbi:Fe(3+) ABC transporter substrate-binding protein [Ectothiorhodospiraceae bacterium 2226]|nr:Fe(3+) ABC transporter substrate-binding protein [Ectothiorhodospiraceae bacterium 2226]
MRKLLVIALGLLLAAGAFAAAAQEVNVYSARQEVLIKPLMDRFTAETGIRVNLVAGRADALVQRLQSEGRNTRADVLLTVDAGNLNRAMELELFQPVQSELLAQAVPAHLRDADGRWFALSMRARPIVYARDRVDPNEITGYADLADERWRRRVCVRSSDNVYNQSLVAAMIATQGAEAAEQWVRGLVRNFARPPRGGDRDQIKAVAAGQCDLTLVNTYYLAAMRADAAADERAAAQRVGIIWPDQDGQGVHINVSGAGVTRHAPNRDNAQRLLEFLVSEEAQRWYAETNHEYPVRPGVPVSAALREFGDFKAEEVPLATLGRYNAEAVRLMDRAGWR